MRSKSQLAAALFALLAAGACRHVHPPTVADHVKPVAVERGPAPPEVHRTLERPPASVEAAAPFEPAPSEPDPATLVRTLLAAIADAYFDYDRYELRQDAVAALEKNSALLRSIFERRPDLALTMEGHCDERGSAEYNLALGDLRAQRAREFLMELGISASRLRVISFGKERPQCTASTEDCWQKNRRAHLADAR